MIGLMYLLFFLVYLALLVWATKRGWHWGVEKKGWVGKKRWLGAAIGFLVVYLPAFWDWIPTIALHQYYCAKDSGFWVYKTLDQWNAENPGVAQTLVAYKGVRPKEERFDGGDGRTDTYFLNKRFNWIVTQQDISSLFPIIMVEQQVKDVANNEVLARYVDFGTGNSVGNFVSMPLKFWLHSGSCSGGEMNDSKLAHFFIAAKNINEKGSSKRAKFKTSAYPYDR